MQTQLSFGLMSGVEQVKPFAEGDIVVRVRGSEHVRFVVTAVVPDAYAEPALVCVNLANGSNAILFEREVTYRSR